MSNDDNSNSTDQIVDAIKDIVPVIYDDALKPVSKEVGKALGTLGKTVNMALAPISAVVWGYEQIEDFVVHKVTNKLENVSEEDIIIPDATIAGPLLESLKYTGHKEELQEMYANLLASAMNKNSADNAHPSFVEIIKQLTSDEAILIKYLSKRKEYPLVVSTKNTNKTSTGRFSRFGLHGRNENNNEKIVSDFNIIAKEKLIDYNKMILDNLLRLKILEIQSTTNQSLDDDFFSSFRGEKGETTLKIEIKNKIMFTEFGQSFINTCINNS